MSPCWEKNHNLYNGTSVSQKAFFFVAPPPVQEPNQEAWAIDFAIKNTGRVIPQPIWAPRNQSDAQRYVRHEQLRRPPILFVLKNGGGLGLPLKAAAAGNCMCLQGAEQVASVGPSSHAQIRINVSSILTSQVRD